MHAMSPFIGCDDIMLLKIVETGKWDRAFGDQGSDSFGV